MSDIQSQYRFMFDHMTHGAFFQDADGTLVDINEVALQLLGLTRDQFLSRTSYHPEWRIIDQDGTLLLPEQHPSMACLQSGKTVKDRIIGVYHPINQDYAWLQVNATPMFHGGETRPYRVFVTFHDITEQKRTTERLVASEERYRAIVNTQLEFVDRFLPGGILTFVNDALCRYSGMTRDQLLGKSWYQFIHEADRQKQISLIEALTVDNPVMHSNVYAVLPDGSRRWQEWTNHAIFDREGRLIEYQAVGRDITRQKLAEEALEKSERKYRHLHEAMIDGFAMTDMKGKIKEWNEAFRVMIGYPPEEIPRLTYQDITPKKWHEAEKRIIDEEVVPKGFSRVYEKEYIRRDGTVLPIEIRTYLLKDHLGKANGLWAIIRDISERKRMENALRESEERYRRFIDTANEGIGITDRNSAIIYLNNRLAEIFGYCPDEIIGKTTTAFLHEEELQTREQLFAEVRTGRSVQQELRFRHKNGSMIWLLISATPIFDNDGEFQGCFAMFTDLTRRKAAEDALQHANDELEARVTERTAALSAANEQIKLISFKLLQAEEHERARIAAELHDQVGQSLLLAKMKLDMLADELREGEKRSSADNISSLLEASIHDIRTLTFGMRPPLLDTAGIEAALEWLCTAILKDYNLRIEFSCICRQIPFSREIRYSLYQAIRELLLNVAKHAGTDRARLELRTRENGLVVNVADTGKGFDPAARNRAAMGRGIGLFNVQQRIEQMGGSVTISSAPGAGTSVTLNIPLEGNCLEGDQ